jgi:hypothetical protein
MLRTPRSRSSRRSTTEDATVVAGAADALHRACALGDASAVAQVCVLDACVRP